MYRVMQATGDVVPVPQLVFTRLQDYDADETRFRVALYMLSKGEGDAANIAKELKIQPEKAASALSFWEGAGLVQCTDAAATQKTVPLQTAQRKRLNARDVAQMSLHDPTLGMLTQELQRVFGGVVSEADIGVFATLYVQDEFPAELILMAAGYCVALGKVSARYIEKVLFSWRREGITDCETADDYLKKLQQRAVREQEIATLMGMQQAVFTLAERKRIAQWFEDFAYTHEMIEIARLTAGDKKDEVKYIGTILSKWHAKGYKTVRDVQQNTQNHNLRVEGTRTTLPAQQDMLLQGGYVPMKRWRTGE